MKFWLLESSDREPLLNKQMIKKHIVLYVHKITNHEVHTMPEANSTIHEAKLAVLEVS